MGIDSNVGGRPYRWFSTRLSITNELRTRPAPISDPAGNPSPLKISPTTATGSVSEIPCVVQKKTDADFLGLERIDIKSLAHVFELLN
jgi:hypothetical protein